MGTKWSSHADAAAPRTATITEKEVLTLCEDGDLLLMRERVVHAKLRVTIDHQVAQDIARFQQGEFPTTRITQLQAWTSCALLLRLSGVLHLLEVTLSGLQLVPFEERVADRAARRDVYAIRRIQHVHTEKTSETLRQLAFELSQALPIHWGQAPSLSPITVPAPPSSPSTQPPSPRSPMHVVAPSPESVLSLRKALSTHPTIHAVLQRALQLFHQSYKLSSPQSQLDDASAQLATAVTVAVYERLAFTTALDTSSSSFIRLVPSCLYSKTEPASARIAFMPPNALGAEMRLAC